MQICRFGSGSFYKMSFCLLLFRGGDPYSLNLSRTSKLCQEPIQIRLRIIRVLIQRNMKFEKAPEYRRYHPLRGQRIIIRFPVRAVNLNFLSVFQNGTVYIALVPVLERRSLKPGSVIRKTRPHKTGLQRDAVFLKEWLIFLYFFEIQRQHMILMGNYLLIQFLCIYHFLHGFPPCRLPLQSRYKSSCMPAPILLQKETLSLGSAITGKSFDSA